VITVGAVVVGAGARHQLGGVLPDGVRRAVVVTQQGLPVIDVPVPHEVIEIGGGEDHKTMATVEHACRCFVAAGLTRADCVIGVGGGIVTDVAGFAAAVYHRGVSVVHVPTTLLGMVDAAVGGKTGVNLPDGKNLVGAFHMPVAVLCDTDLLATLPEREWRCGNGEMAKYHFLTGDDFLALPLDERIARCVAIKSAVVAEDPFERTGRRAILNYGHTLGHALEIAGGFDLRHGEAVAVGLLYAAELAHVLGRIGPDRVAEHRRVLDAYGLDGCLPHGSNPDHLLSLMHRDKKATTGGLTFVLDGPDGVEPVAGVDPAAARVALDRLAARPVAP
jgi:5-deoxy-5-amino-3-dehydroquinate synthase